MAGGYEVTGPSSGRATHEWHFVITLVRTSPAETDIQGGLSQLILDLKAPSLRRAFIARFEEVLADTVCTHRRGHCAAAPARSCAVSSPAGSGCGEPANRIDRAPNYLAPLQCF